MAQVGAVRAKATLHWLDRSRAQRMVWLLRECKGLDLEIKVYKRQKNMTAPPELKKVHPLGKAPVVTLEAPSIAKPIVFAESAAIFEYFCDHFAPHLVPRRYQEGKEGQVGGETEPWLRYRFFMHYAEGSLIWVLVVLLLLETAGTSAPYIIRPIARAILGRINAAIVMPMVATHFSFLEEQLTTSPDSGRYLCGSELTAADILMSFPLISARTKVDTKTYPKLSAYIEGLRSSEGYRGSVSEIEKVTGESYVDSL